MLVSRELCRFSRRCSRLSDFLAASTRMIEKMVEMDYVPDKISAKVRKVVARAPRLYNCNAKARIQRNLTNVARRAAARKAHQERGREGRKATLQFMRSIEEMDKEREEEEQRHVELEV